MPQASVSVSQSFQNLLDTVFHAIPEILIFLVILVVGWLIAKALAKVVDMVLRRFHFDHLADRGVVGDALRRSNTDATALIAKIVYYAILLIALQMAFGVFGPNPISAVLSSIVAWLPKLIVAIIIVVLASAIAKVVKDLITDAIGGLTYGRFLASLASVVIIAIGVVAALTQIGIASAITLPILYIALITVGATIAIGVGGGLIRPMQSRWERMLTAAEHETNAQIAAYQAGRTDAMRAPAQAQAQQVPPAVSSSPEPGTEPGSTPG